MEFACPVIAPSTYDVQIPDITPSQLNIIGEELDSIALSETLATPAFPVQGTIFGQSKRMFIPLIVSNGKISIKVNFLFDSVSPHTYLRRETLAALGLQGSSPSGTDVIIHGTTITVYESSNNFQNVDSLGQEYLTEIRGVLTIDYALKFFEINMK
jgi:hypothetical protein